jgi:UDP-GlcNAc:undecaprenyl-phosphate GlcNAc-1-phosphate transferase
MNLNLSILSLVPLSFLISWVATFLMKRAAPRFGFVDKPGGRKIHANPKPLGGGVAIFLGFAVPLLLGLAIVQFTQPSSFAASLTKGHAADLSAYWSGIRDRTPAALAMVVAALCMHALGLADDHKALGPYFKLFVQLSITTGLVLFVRELRAFSLPQLGVPKIPAIVVTVLWIGAITNAFNFLDNMDGLSAGVAAVCTAAFLVATLLIQQWFVAAALALLLGALLGFLCFNFSPATIFMGDSGSLLIGLILGALTVRTTNLKPGQNLGAGWYSLFAPVIVLAVPLYDLIVVSAIRLGRGKSPFVGDTNHFSHRLVARGMSRRTAVLCLYLISAATAMAAIILPYAPTPFVAVLIFVQTLLILGVVMLLEQHPLPIMPERPISAPPIANVQATTGRPVAQVSSL